MQTHLRRLLLCARLESTCFRVQLAKTWRRSVRGLRLSQCFSRKTGFDNESVRGQLGFPRRQGCTYYARSIRKTRSRMEYEVTVKFCRLTILRGYVRPYTKWLGSSCARFPSPVRLLGGLDNPFTLCSWDGAQVPGSAPITSDPRLSIAYRIYLHLVRKAGIETRTQTRVPRSYWARLAFIAVCALMVLCAGGFMLFCGHHSTSDECGALVKGVVYHSRPMRTVHI